MKKLTPKQDRVLTVVMWVVLALAALPLLHYGRIMLMVSRLCYKPVLSVSQLNCIRLKSR